MRRSFSFVFPAAIPFLLTCPNPTAAQDRSPELQRLGFLVGEWTFEMNTGGSGTEVCEWPGPRLLRCDDEYALPSGVVGRMVGVWGYDPDQEVYTWHRYWGNGRIDHSIGWVDGDTWTFIERTDGSPRRAARLTIVEESATGYSFQWESSIQGQDWVPSSHGTATKVR